MFIVGLENVFYNGPDSITFMLSEPCSPCYKNSALHEGKMETKMETIVLEQ